VGPARVSSPQVDLPCYGLDETLTLLAPQSRGTRHIAIAILHHGGFLSLAGGRSEIEIDLT